MEITDIVYLMLLDKFNGMNWPVTLYYGYIYDYKAVDISYADWILVYDNGSTMDWFGIGGNNYRVINTVTIDVRTIDKSRYGDLKRYIKSIFDGTVFSFTSAFSGIPIALEYGVDFDDYQTVGVYVDKLHLVDPNMYTFSRGDAVQITDSAGKIITAYVWGVYDDWLYIVKKAGVYCIIRPRRVQDLSDKMRKMYRFVMDVEGNLIENVGGE